MASSDLSVTIIQTDLVWENPSANLNKIETLIQSIENETDIIVLPEMFTTGFSMNPKSLFEKPEGRTLDWLKKTAEHKSGAIIGSIIIKENEQFYNRLFFVKPDGSYHTYDKKHLFTLAGEHENYTAGRERLIVDYKGWKICPLICYDLRFPVWARYQDDYDLLIYVANWPERRIKAWDTLLQARAIENMCYCIGVNRVGTDGNNYPYVGHSAIYDVLGEHISTFDYDKAFVETQRLSFDKLNSIREKLGFLDDRDSFTVN